MKKWEVINKVKSLKPERSEIVRILLENRGIKTKKDIEEFLSPKLTNVTVKSVGIDKKQLKQAINRIKRAIKNKEQIVVFGDYDVDGICGAAILWETLSKLKAKVMPYIPHRIDEGYGLSIKGIENVIKQLPDTKLIITVDNGIVAGKAVDFAKSLGIEVIITDHHVSSKQKPKAFSIVHTTKLCGAGVAWMFAKEFTNNPAHLELVALATVADLVPLTFENRTLLRYGLKELRSTKRPGLLALFREAQIDPQTISVYEIGHIIAPRLNAMGRLESAMDSLRFICTIDKKRASNLAFKLGSTNRERQGLTEQTVILVKTKLTDSGLIKEKLLFVADEKYEQGVIGLVAGKLVEEFYKPAIVISKGKEFSKASARSINGFNIIEFIRSELELLVDVGGHPMAAGFTVENSKLLLLEKKLQKRASELLDEELLKRTLKIDLEIPVSVITQSLYDEMQKLSPFGMKNPEPVFLSKELLVFEMRLVGNGGKHIKFRLKSKDLIFDAIAFGMGKNMQNIHVGDSVDAVYVIDENEWNGNKKLQLKIRDIKKS